VALGDVTGDGKADIVATESSGSYYTYMLGTSSGTNFGWSTTNLVNYWTPYHMALGDVNNDGKADIVSVEADNNNPGGGYYHYQFGIRGSSSFGWTTAMTAVVPQQRMAVGDVTGDGKDDVVSIEAY
jgi:hypothetical protein